MTALFPQPPSLTHPGMPAAVCLDETDFPLPDQACCLCVITGVEGPSYRPLGAAMTVDAAGVRRGTLSSGCIEADVALHAARALADRQVRQLRYGRGSRAADLELPCGGALQITLIPAPGQGVIAAARSRLAAREPACFGIGQGGLIALDDPAGAPVPGAALLAVMLVPRLRLLILGKGPEPLALFRMARAAGIESEYHSADPQPPQGAIPLSGRGWPADARLDARSAVALFFHDHDREPPLLAAALDSPAFYVGALGSARAHAMRLAALAEKGVAQDRIARMVQPFGIVPHARDPIAIAAGVLAQVLADARLG